jgi:RNA-directed DNA polymerase
MTADSSAGAVSHISIDWHAIPGQTVQETVRRLPARIVQAAKAGTWHKGHALQHLLPHALRGTALAVRRVTANQGKHTPGVDNVTWQDPESKGMAIPQMPQRGYNALPLHRVYIPQSNGKQRPLGIPMLYS